MGSPVTVMGEDGSDLPQYGISRLVTTSFCKTFILMLLHITDSSYITIIWYSQNLGQIHSVKTNPYIYNKSYNS